MSSNLTRKQAIALAESGWWKDLSARDITAFQLFEERLCMPFDVFHEAVEAALARPVYTHEFGRAMDSLRDEFLGGRPAPTFEEILSLIPTDKRVIVVTA
jgi:hypothetical protein